MIPSDLIPVGVLGALVLLLLVKSVVIVTEQTAVVIERLGRFHRIANSGFELYEKKYAMLTTRSTIHVDKLHRTFLMMCGPKYQN